MGQVSDARGSNMCLKRTVWFLFFKLLLFQTLLVWCNARLISINNNNFYNGGDFSDNYNNKKILSDPLLTNDVRSFILADILSGQSQLTAGRGFPEQGAQWGEDGSGESPGEGATESPGGGDSTQGSYNYPQTDTLHREQRAIEDEILGMYAREHVSGAACEVTVPLRVAADGAFVSHQLSAPHEAEHGGRARRSLRPGDQLGPEDPPQLHYNLTVGGRALRLDLRPETGFISPHLVVERHGRAEQYRGTPGDTEACHYRGQVAGQPGSHVALSACRGLAGMLRTEHGEYWLEPAHPAPPEGQAHPHVIYKRSAAGAGGPRAQGKGKGKDKGKGNGVGKGKGKGMGKGNGKGKGKGMARGRGKSIARRRRRRRKNKNCGTKEPPWQGQLNRGTTGIHSKSDETIRKARSVSRPRHVEVLLVADSSMTDFHQKGNVETYLLTIMNMVSSLYLDHSIGNYINVVVVKIILLEEEQEDGRGLNITTNADTTLANFCRWQKDLNPDGDSHPNHHDVAILITRKDICARHNVPCSTLGVAHVAGMCLPDRSCSVNEDNGITLAHTITHELGHNFGMYHDTEKIGCHRRVGTTLHVMTPIFEADTVEVAWSPCSKRDLTNFLDSGMGECLADQPAQVDYIYPELPPGALYDAARQCRLQFGDGVEEVCTELNEICMRLWCVVKGTCTTMLRPAAPGTECGQGMWCQNHTCVARTSPPPPQNGEWGAWSAWSECSRACGAGVSVMERDCDSPRPSHGGIFCTGERKRYQLCNTQPCPKGDPSFRQVQCSRHDNTTHDGKLVDKWQPYFDQDEPCELYCSTTDESVIVPFGEYAKDGTPCNLGTRDMCISGICRKVGCDWVVDSPAVEDTCGICNGNGTACKQVQGIYSKGTTKESGYSEVAVIPAGSRNIKIEEAANSKNYIGIGSAKSRRFYLNGKRKITMAGEYLVAGTPALYERDRDLEKVKIPGPIEEDILIYQMIYRGRQRPPGVRYQYTVDRRRGEPGEGTEGPETPGYRWGAADWTECSSSCGRGIMRQPVVCLNSSEEPVDQEFCISNNEMEKPSELMRVCNNLPCTTFWWVGPWSSCPQCIKEINQPTQHRRKVLCLNRQDNRQLAESECDAKNKPVALINCGPIPKCKYYYY